MMNLKRLYECYGRLADQENLLARLLLGLGVPAEQVWRYRVTPESPWNQADWHPMGYDQECDRVRSGIVRLAWVLDQLAVLVSLRTWVPVGKIRAFARKAISQEFITNGELVEAFWKSA